MSGTSRLLVLAAMLAFSSPTAMLGAGCAKSGGSAKSSGDAAATIEPVGIESFDTVFTRAAELDGTLDSARQKLRQGRNQVADAMGLAKGTNFSDSLTELKSKANNKLEVVLEGGTPKLKATDAIPSDVQAAVDAVNSYMDTLVSVKDDLAELPDECRSLATAVTAFPEQFQSDYKNWDVKVTEVPSMLKQIKTNTEVTVGLPDSADKLLRQASKNLKAVRSGFSGSGSVPADAGEDFADEDLGDDSETAGTSEPTKEPTKGTSDGGARSMRVVKPEDK